MQDHQNLKLMHINNCWQRAAECAFWLLQDQGSKRRATSTAHFAGLIDLFCDSILLRQLLKNQPEMYLSFLVAPRNPSCSSMLQHEQCRTCHTSLLRGMLCMQRCFRHVCNQCGGRYNRTQDDVKPMNHLCSRTKQDRCAETPDAVKGAE